MFRTSRLVLVAGAPLLMTRSVAISVMMEPAERIKSSFIAGLIADSLALGGHYEYSAQRIKASGGFKDFSPPGEANNGIGWGTACYHPGKIAGDLTDAGVHALNLRDSLREGLGQQAVVLHQLDERVNDTPLFLFSKRKGERKRGRESECQKALAKDREV